MYSHPQVRTSFRCVYKDIRQAAVYNNRMSEVLSVRVSRGLKREAEELGIDVRRVVEEALRREILKARQKRFREVLERALKGMHLSEEEWVLAVRESRRER